VKGIKAKRILNDGISHDLDAIDKEVGCHFKETMLKIERAQGEE
jgi:hypothetical protein